MKKILLLVLIFVTSVSYCQTAEEYFNKAYGKNEIKDYQGAIEDYTKAIEINPNYSEAYNNRGTVKTNFKDYKGAIEDYTKAIGINSNYSDAYNSRGTAKSILEDYRGAIADYTKAIEINPNDSEAYNYRGDSKVQLKDYQGAIEDYTKAIELNPNYSDAYYNRGVSKLNLNQKESAYLDWIKAEELGDSDAYDLIKKYFKVNLLNRYLSETDKFNGEKTYYGGGTIVSFMKVIGKGKSSQYVSVNVYGSTLNYGCYGVSILFENGKKIIRSNEKVDTDYNDSGWRYKAFFTPTLNEINLLKTQKITAVKLYIYDADVDDSESNTILKDARIILTTPQKK
jgi:tetratricopeptide (TPR) repeat protein